MELLGDLLRGKPLSEETTGPVEKVLTVTDFGGAAFEPTVWNGPGRVVWFENSGDAKGRWRMRVIKDDWPRANQVLTADLDGDGRLDVIAGAERGSNEVRWWRNLGEWRK